MLKRLIVAGAISASLLGATTAYADFPKELWKTYSLGRPGQHYL